MIWKCSGTCISSLREWKSGPSAAVGFIQTIQPPLCVWLDRTLDPLYCLGIHWLGVTLSSVLNCGYMSWSPSKNPDSSCCLLIWYVQGESVQCSYAGYTYARLAMFFILFCDVSVLSEPSSGIWRSTYKQEAKRSHAVWQLTSCPCQSL